MNNSHAGWKKLKPWNHETPLLTSHDTKRETFSFFDYMGRGDRYIGFAMKYTGSDKHDSPITLQLPQRVTITPGADNVPMAGWILGAWDSDSYNWDVAVNTHPAVFGATPLVTGLLSRPDAVVSFASDDSTVTQRPLIFGGFTKVLQEAGTYSFNEDIHSADRLMPGYARNSTYPSFSGYY